MKSKFKKILFALGLSIMLHFTLINKIDKQSERLPPESGKNGKGNGGGVVKLKIVPKNDGPGNSKCDNFYGGVGLTHDSLFVLTVPYGYPAQKAGILPGDQVINPDYDLLRGDPGTSVIVEVLRNHIEYMRFDLIRENICEKN